MNNVVEAACIITLCFNDIHDFITFDTHTRYQLCVKERFPAVAPPPPLLALVHTESRVMIISASQIAFFQETNVSMLNLVKRV